MAHRTAEQRRAAGLWPYDKIYARFVLLRSYIVLKAVEADATTGRTGTLRRAGVRRRIASHSRTAGKVPWMYREPKWKEKQEKQQLDATDVAISDSR